MATNSAHMWNVYVGAALRTPNVFPGHAADDDDCTPRGPSTPTSTTATTSSVRAAYRAADLTPPFIVVTGRTPLHTRATLVASEELHQGPRCLPRASSRHRRQPGTDPPSPPPRHAPGRRNRPAEGQEGRSRPRTDRSRHARRRSARLRRRRDRPRVPPQTRQEAPERPQEAGGSLAGAMAAAGAAPWRPCDPTTATCGFAWATP